MNNKLSFAALVLSVAIAGCGSGSKSESAAPEIATGPVKGNIELVAFQGGFNIDLYEKFAKDFEAKNPGTKVKVSGSPEVWKELQPRFVSGDVPDLTFPGWGLHPWVNAEEDQLVQLDKILEGKPYSGSGTWKDTFEPSLLALGQMEGKQYMLPYYFNVLGWYYNPKLFAQNGWTAPKTYEELLALCAKIKAKGLAPITYQGKYPEYMEWGMFLPWVQSIGGADAIKDAENLVPGAWKSPAVLQAAKMLKELKDKGYFQDGAAALTHTISQQEFLDGKVAMIPCGTWLPTEMQKTMPKDASFQFMLTPVVTGGKGDPSSVHISIEPWMIPSKAKNIAGGVALFKYMTSLEKAKEFVEKKGTLMAIKGSDQVTLPEPLKAPAKIFKDSKHVWAVQFRQWYPELDKEVQNSLTSLMSGDLTPEAFADRLEAAAEKTRKDANVTKHKL